MGEIIENIRGWVCNLKEKLGNPQNSNISSESSS
jgi:hypothetical protein